MNKPTDKGDKQLHEATLAESEPFLPADAVTPDPDDLVPLALWHRDSTRRDVLKQGMAGMAMLGTMPVAALAGGPFESSTSDSKPGNGKPKTEMRDFVFDLSLVDTSIHHVTVVAGKTRRRVKPLSSSRRRKLLRRYPVMGHVAKERMTHHVSLPMSSEGLHLCYLKRSIEPRHQHGKKAREWDMLGMFMHTPSDVLVRSANRLKVLYADSAPPVPLKWERHGATHQSLAAANDPVGMDSFKDATDSACTMVTSHPEANCYDPDGHAHITSTIVNGPDVKYQLGQLTDVLEGLGAAKAQSDWSDCSSPIVPNTSGYATLVPICNPDTGEIAQDSHGDNLYVPYNDDRVDLAAGEAIVPTVQNVKDDQMLGGNIASQPDGTNGYIYRTEDGVSTVDQSQQQLGAAPPTGFNISENNKSPDHGYKVHVTASEEGDDGQLTALITFKATNWYVRWLGLYVRYLDGEGNPLKLSDVSLSSNTRETYFPLIDCCDKWSTEYDQFVSLIGPEFELFGIPVSKANESLTIPVPVEASSVMILGSGLGHTSKASNPYFDTTIPGDVMTGLINLALPTMFLSVNAAVGLAPMDSSLKNNATLIKFLPIFLGVMAALFEETQFDNPAGYKSLATSIATKITAAAFKDAADWIAGFMEEGAKRQAVEDAIPVIGAILAAMTAAGVVAQLAQTSIEVATSPSTYEHEVSFTHDIIVNVHPDPKDSAGWPATATEFRVLAQFDGASTPQMNPVMLPPGTFSGPQTVTLEKVPLGGFVTLTAIVYTGTNFQVGHASLGPIRNIDPDKNTPLEVDLTIKELMVPLDETTVYSHKEVIQLDATGNHVWHPTTMPPLATQPTGCGFSDGQLCKLGGITINSTAGDVGYVFQSYSSDVGECGSSSTPRQLYQFANMSITDTPESTYFNTDCGFPSSPRVVYDLLNKPDNNYYLDSTTRGSGFEGGVIRQIRLSDGNQGFDEPNSNRAFGKLRLPSDALLLHPAGKIISINTEFAKVEVLTLPQTATTDADAPLTNAYGGKGEREGLMLGPLLAALTPDGAILVLERDNNRIQAFDLNANSIPRFILGSYHFPLRDQDTTNYNVDYLDMTTEFKGYIFVLYKLTPRLSGGDPQFVLDIYKPDGTFLATTPDFVADKLTVNYWRDIFAESYQPLTLPGGGAPGITEPAISHWIPSTP